MRKFLFTGLVVSLLASCSSGEPETTDHANAEHAMESAEATVPAIAGKLDPVCEMTYDTSWTESTVYMSDTVHFCSENCKTAFLARPEKYTKSAH